MPDGSLLREPIELGYFGDPLLLDIDAVLNNWARWSRTRRAQGHCASIEHRFRTPNHFHPPPIYPAINLHAAIATEREMRQMPRQHQQAIIWHYVWLAPSRFICRRIKVQHADWERFLADAVCMIRNRIQTPAKPQDVGQKQQHRANIVPPPLQHPCG